MRAVIQSAAFLELSGDDIIHPDAAVRELESLSESLQMLNATERKVFADFAARYADSELKANQPQQRVEFIRSLPQALGLVD